MEQPSPSLAENFLQYFDVALAVSEEQKKDVYHLRHSVYCEEFKYEPADRFPNKEESDGFDKDSLHCLITHKSSNTPAGCVRMVKTSDNLDNNTLPFEMYCKDSLDTQTIEDMHLARNTMCEISRLAVDGPFRRRLGETVTRFGKIDSIDCTRQEMRTFSMIAVAGFLSATALTSLTNRSDVFAMMEPFLPRLLKRSGIVFQRVGSDIDYHGLRAPYFIKTESALENMRTDLLELYEEIYRNISADFTH